MHSFLMKEYRFMSLNYFKRRKSRDARYVYTNTRSCPPGFSKFTSALKSRDQELSNGIWHPYIAKCEAFHKAIFMLHAALSVTQLTLRGADLCVTQLWSFLSPQNWQIPESRVPLIFGQWASLKGF